MNKTDQLIESMSGQIKGQEKPLRLAPLFVLWIAGLALYVALIFGLGVLPLRTDLAEVVMRQPLFALEIASLIALVLCSAWAASVVGFPDNYQKTHPARLPLKAFVVFVLVLAFSLALTPSEVEPGPGIDCLICISGLSLLPAILMFYRLRRMATVHPDMAGMLCSLCAFGLGALILRLSERTNDIPHVVIWHYAPMLAISAFGFWLGARVLKW